MALDEVLFYTGFTKDEQDIVMSAAASPSLETKAWPITDQTINRTLSEILVEMEQTSEPGGKAAESGGKAVILGVGSKERAVEIMSRIKAGLAGSGEQDMIFAMITEKALTWTFRYYLEHLAEEHAFMKSGNSPEEDPDMKPVSP